MVKELLIFAVGAGLGTAATYLVLNVKYKTIIDEEINDIRDSYDKRRRELDEKAEKIVEAKVAATESSTKSENVLKEMAQKYTKPNEEQINYSDFYNKSEEEVNPVTETIDNLFEQHKDDIVDDEEVTVDRYEIPPYAFFDDDKYDKRSFIFTRDNILIDEQLSEIGDADNQIGNDILAVFANDPEETELYVRNDALELDYEIIKSERNFDEFDPSEKEDVD